MGIVNLVRAFKGGGWGVGVIGVVDFLIGILLLTSPMMISIALPIVIGILSLLGGVVLIILSFRYRKTIVFDH